MTDIRGKSIPEVLEIARKQMRPIIESSMIDCEDLLRAHGATKQELIVGLAQQRAMLERNLSAHLKDLAVWLGNGGEVLH